jgi:hypothetical protein
LAPKVLLAILALALKALLALEVHKELKALLVTEVLLEILATLVLDHKVQLVLKDLVAL